MTTIYFIYNLTIAFRIWRFHLCFEKHQHGVHLWGLSCSTIYVSHLNLCSSQSLFSAVIKNPIQKSHKLLAERTSVMLTSGLAYKKTLSLHHLMCKCVTAADAGAVASVLANIQEKVQTKCAGISPAFQRCFSCLFGRVWFSHYIPKSIFIILKLNPCLKNAQTALKNSLGRTQNIGAPFLWFTWSVYWLRILNGSSAETM